MDTLDQLLALINAQNAAPALFTRDNVELINPVPNAGAQWNTKATLRAKPNTGYTGSTDVFYYRIDLAELIDGSGLIEATGFTPELVVEKINANWLTWLTVDDLEPFTIPDLSDGEIHDVLLVAKPSSLGWFGQVTISLVQWDQTPLDTLLHVTLPSGYIS